MEVAAYEFQNALDSYILIMFPFFYQEGRRKTGREEREEEEDGDDRSIETFS